MRCQEDSAGRQRQGEGRRRQQGRQGREETAVRVVSAQAILRHPTYRVAVTSTEPTTARHNSLILYSTFQRPDDSIGGFPIAREASIMFMAFLIRDNQDDKGEKCKSYKVYSR